MGKFGEANSASLQNVYVPVRIIMRGEDQYFGEEVTRTNNRQNRIENRDFVALDPEQGRIRTELAIDGVDYQLMRSEAVTRTESSFDLVEATTALACASGTVRLPVQLKREIGKLWDDISKAPYKELFNANVPGIYVWHCVQVQRRIDRALETFLKRGGNADQYGVATHGNRLIAAMVFDGLPVAAFRDPSFDLEAVAPENVITRMCDERLDILFKLVEAHYTNSIIPTLFKNLKKCEHLMQEARRTISERATAA
jgi:AIPR protein